VTADGLIDLAHPEAADWLLGTLEPAAAAEFGDHLAGCGDCQTAVAELGHVGRVLQQLPPAAEPSPDLAARIVDSVLAAAAGDRTEVHLPRLPAALLAPRPRPQAPPAQRPLPPPELASLYHPSPGTRHRRAPAARNDTPAPAAGAARPARRQRRAGRYAIAAAAAAAAAVGLAAAIAFLPGLAGTTSAEAPVIGGGTIGAAVLIVLHPAAGTASGQATAWHLPGGWSVRLQVRGLGQLAPGQYYACWYAGSGNKSRHPVLISAGTFSVGPSGSADVSMWTAADPRQFRTMEITAESPGDASQHGRVILSGVART
jgi:Anti-sigma-K factor rskA